MRHQKGVGDGFVGDWGLGYNTLADAEILDIDVNSLSNCGFCFLWVINSKLQFGFECLNKWGYTYVDKVIAQPEKLAETI